MTYSPRLPEHGSLTSLLLPPSGCVYHVKLPPMKAQTSSPEEQIGVLLRKRGMKLAVVSDAPGREAWLRLCYLNFHYIFDHVVTFEERPAVALRAS